MQELGEMQMGPREFVLQRAMPSFHGIVHSGTVIVQVIAERYLLWGGPSSFEVAMAFHFLIRNWYTVPAFWLHSMITALLSFFDKLKTASPFAAMAVQTAESNAGYSP